MYKLCIHVYDVHIYIYIYIYVYPPTSPERRACETTAIKINHAFQHPSPSSKAAAQAAQDDPCLQQPRLDGAKSDQLFFYRGHSSAQTRCNPGPQGARPRAPCPPPGPSNWCCAARECQIANLTGIQASNFQASIPQVPEVSGRGGSLQIRPRARGTSPPGCQ